MKVVTSLPNEVLTNHRAGALCARELLRAVVKINELLLTWKPKIPLLYNSGVRYQSEPNAGKYEDFANCQETLARGWGDCDDLAAWRAAEIRVRERRPADILIYWRPKGEKGALWHVQVRHWPSMRDKLNGGLGEVEDPSRLLGM